MEAFNTQQKSGNYEEITKLAQDILIKINKGYLLYFYL